MARKKKLTQGQIDLAEKLALKKAHIKSSYFTREDARIMSWCNNRGLTIYAACQINFKVKLFKQFGEGFLPLSEKEYGQYDDDDQLALIHDIKQGYLAYYNKFKNRK